MNDEVIEPSEILINGDGTVREKLRKAQPWLRFLGRMCDYALFFTAVGLIRGAIRPVTGQLQPLGGLAPLEYFSWIPIEAAFLWACGTTPGKWLLGTRLKQGRLARLDYVTALRRSAKVWLRGMGMAIPFINAFCMLVAYQKLMTFQTTTWDREEYIQVTHSPVGLWRLILAAGIAVMGLGYYFQMQ